MAIRNEGWHSAMFLRDVIFPVLVSSAEDWGQGLAMLSKHFPMSCIPFKPQKTSQRLLGTREAWYQPLRSGFPRPLVTVWTGIPRLEPGWKPGKTILLLEKGRILGRRGYVNWWRSHGISVLCPGGVTQHLTQFCWKHSMLSKPFITIICKYSANKKYFYIKSPYSHYLDTAINIS